jgi:redox-sensitive bicupin YhaK (pirin superfamily)
MFKHPGQIIEPEALKGVSMIASPTIEATSTAKQRKIAHSTRGQSGGMVTRLMSPGDLGEMLKPFVFLDLFDTGDQVIRGRNLHPHSGIATVTYVFEGSTRYEDTTGASGILAAGGVEWFKAGRGAWHGGGAGEAGRTRGFQLWLALPPGHELGSVESINLTPLDVPGDGPARVVVGSYGTTVSDLDPGSSLNYLAVTLRAGESWSYQPPVGHLIAWMSVAKGRLAHPGRISAGDLVIFEPSETNIDITAESDTEFVIGSGVPATQDLALGTYSVHTGPESLAEGEGRIVEIGQRLRAQGQL